MFEGCAETCVCSYLMSSLKTTLYCIQPDHKAQLKYNLSTRAMQEVGPVFLGCENTDFIIATLQLQGKVVGYRLHFYISFRFLSDVFKRVFHLPPKNYFLVKLCYLMWSPLRLLYISYYLKPTLMLSKDSNVH